MARQDPARKLEAVLKYRASLGTEEPRSLADVAAEYGMGVATLKRAHWKTPHDGSPPPPGPRGGRRPTLADAEVDEVVAFVRDGGRTTWRKVIEFVSDRFHKSITTTTLRKVLAARGVTKSSLEKETPPSAPATSRHRYTQAHRRTAPASKDRRGYPSDFTDAEWVVFEPLLREHARGLPKEHDARDVFNGIRYLLRTGCQWRYLPHEYPPWRTVQNWFQRWSKDGTFDRVTDALRERVRAADGREPTPSAVIIDSQTAKKTEKGGPAATTRGRRSRGPSDTSS